MESALTVVNYSVKNAYGSAAMNANNGMMLNVKNNLKQLTMHDDSDGECPNCGKLFSEECLWVCCDECQQWYDVECQKLSSKTSQNIFLAISVIGGQGSVNSSLNAYGSAAMNANNGMMLNVKNYQVRHPRTFFLQSV